MLLDSEGDPSIIFCYEINETGILSPCGLHALPSCLYIELMSYAKGFQQSFRMRNLLHLK
jgi:hypothetical protein